MLKSQFLLFHWLVPATFLALLMMAINIHGASCNSFLLRKTDTSLFDTNVLAGPQVAAQVAEKERTSVVSFCPDKCSCNITLTSQLQVVCRGHFDHDFPLSTLRKDVEILRIEPECRRHIGAASTPVCQNVIRENSLTIGPNLKHLRLLKELVITDSQVPNIGVRTLWGLSGLRVLNLNRNRLTNLIDKNFDGLYSLKELYLDGNRIRSMVSAAFRHITQLELLSLRDNQIDELAPRIFYKLRHLKYLDLSGNKLEHIDGGIFQDTPSLETFACERCGLFQFKMPESVNLPKLQQLYLAGNTLTNISNNITPKLLTNLQSLDVSENKLKALEVFPSSTLRSFKAAKNNISMIEDCTFCHTSIQEIDLSHNRITRINVDMVYENTRSLRTLILSGNWINLNSLEQFLNRLPDLKTLELAHTGIVNIPATIFNANPELRHLNLSQNLLVDVEAPIIEQLDKLESFDLSSNFLMGLSSRFFQEIEKKKRIRMVYLQNNQWRCDRCHIRPLLSFLKSTLMYWGSCFQTTSPMCLKCSKPDDYLAFPIEELKDDKSLPDCEPLYQEIHFGIVGNGRGYPTRTSSSVSAWSSNSSYFIACIVAILLLALVSLLIAKYRHYGVYRTREDHRLVDDPDEALANPVVVLDRNAESYINLKYPVIPE